MSHAARVTLKNGNLRPKSDRERSRSFFAARNPARSANRSKFPYRYVYYRC
jgi:hypothetical protein